MYPPSANDTNGAAPTQREPPTYQGMTDLFKRRTAANCATHLLPHIKPHFTILDVGCGPGSITLDLARLVPEDRVIGLDHDEKSIATAKSLAEAQGMQNVEFRIGDAQDLSAFSTETFDIVHAHQVLLHVQKPLQTLQEMRRVAKPNGIVSTRDNMRRVVQPLIPALQHHLSVSENFARSRGFNMDFGEGNHLLANEAGFEWDRIEMSSWAWEYSGAEGRKIWASGAKGSFRPIALKHGIATEEEVDLWHEAWEEWEKKPDARFVGLDSALLCWK